MSENTPSTEEVQSRYMRWSNDYERRFYPKEDIEEMVDRCHAEFNRWLESVKNKAVQDYVANRIALSPVEYYREASVAPIVNYSTCKLSIQAGLRQEIDGQSFDLNPEVADFFKVKMLEEFKRYVNKMTPDDIEVKRYNA